MTPEQIELTLAGQFKECLACGKTYWWRNRAGVVDDWHEEDKCPPCYANEFRIFAHILESRTWEMPWEKKDE